MKFTKMQGIGNDFIMIEVRGLDFDWSKTAKTMCDRHFGVGADGLILMLPSTTADFRMRIFNSDGSEAEMCGNGIRCLAKYLVHKTQVKPGTKKITVETLAGERSVKLSYRGEELNKIQVGMGVPRFEAADIPLAVDICETECTVPILKSPIMDYPVTINGQRLFLNFVSMGNPHSVFFVKDKVEDFPLSLIGPKVENYKIFPARTNFEVARVVNKKQIEARVWERGAGETLACGTGACAIAVSARLHNYIDDKVDIKLRGGILSIEWDGKDEVFLSGPAELVFTGEWLKD